MAFCAASCAGWRGKALNNKHTTRKQRTTCRLVAGGAASAVHMCPARPAMEDLPGPSPPDLRRDRRLQALIDRLSCDHFPSSRNSFGECAKNRDGTSVRATVRAPDNRHILDVLSLQSIQVWSVVFELSLDHGLGAIVSSVACIR